MTGNLGGHIAMGLARREQYRIACMLDEAVEKLELLNIRAED